VNAQRVSLSAVELAEDLCASVAQRLSARDEFRDWTRKLLEILGEIGQERVTMYITQATASICSISSGTTRLRAKST
jgi:hypothetical protein